MIIILKRIPENTSDHHIEYFFSPALKGGLFKTAGYIEDISFWEYQIVDTHAIEYYALVKIEPDVVGQRVIKQLNKKLLNGKYIVIQEYHVRHWSNERRVFTSVVSRGKDERRKGERRRNIIKTERKDSKTKHSSVSSYDIWDDKKHL